MTRQADKFPALGLPSEAGPCFVVRRIEDNVRSPSVRDTLERKVERGQDLTNPEAHAVYDREVERGPGGLISKFEISSHAQYRMDLRGITVPEVRFVFQRFQKELNDWKSRQDPAYDRVARAIQRGEPIEYEDKRLQMFIAFTILQKGLAKVITVYWKGMPDPKAPGVCVVPHSHQKHARDPVQDWGTQTYTKDPTDNPDNREKQQVLPTPPWSRSKPTGRPQYNVPGPSGTGPGEKNIHQYRMRTKGEPGKEHPQPPARTSPVRRPEVTGEDWETAGWYDRLDPQVEEPFLEASMKGKPYPGANRQREQRGPARRYYRLRYKRQRQQYKRRMKLWYRRYRKNPRYLRDQERRDDHPKRFERKPGGGYVRNQDRSKAWRDKQKKASLAEPIPVFFLPLQEWGWFEGVGDEDLMEIRVDGSLFQLPIDLFFDQVEGDPDMADALLAYLDEHYEFSEGEGEDMAIDDAIEALKKIAFQVKLRYRPEKRQRKTRGLKKWKQKMQYMRNRAKSKRQTRVRYKRLKRLPAFKKQQQIRRKHPERFKRRMAEVLTAPDIAFVVGEELDLGYVHSVSPMTGLVTFHRTSNGEYLSDSLESLAVEDFMAAVGFLSEADEEAMFKLIDVELGETAWSGELTEDGLRGSAALMGIDCDSPKFQDLCEKLVGKTQIADMDPTEVALVNSVVIHQTVYDDDAMEVGEFPDRDRAKEPTEADSFMIDPQDDDYIFGRVNLPEDYAHLVQRTARRWVARQAEMLYCKEPTDQDSDDTYDRGDDRLEKKVHPPHSERLDQPSVEENPGSAKVIPWNHPDMVNNRAGMVRLAARIHEIVEKCGEDVLTRSRGLRVKLRRVDARNAVWLFDVPGKSGTHRVRIKAVRHGNIRDVGKAHVKVSCSCPFWQWQGPEHHAKTGDYLFGSPRGTAAKPDVKDPGGKHGACKHVLACFDWVIGHNWRVPPRPRKRASTDRVVAQFLRRQLQEAWCG